jgi:hypothetical protein
VSDAPDDKPPMSRSDLRLVAQAVHGKWQVPAAAFADIPRELVVLALTAEQERTKVAAAKVLDAMLKSNRDEERMEAEAPPADETPRLIIPGSDDRHRPGHPR